MNRKGWNSHRGAKFGGLTLAALLLALPASAAEPDAVETLSNHVNWFWTVVAACFVFFMQAGFAFVEAGMVRAKNLINIMMKNLADLSIGTLGFWAVGFGIMFSGDIFEFFPNPDVNSYGEDPNWMYAFILFQTVFAATAATIVSGAMAERTKFGAYLVFSLIITTVIYPVSGSWAWGSLWHGDGWLEIYASGVNNARDQATLVVRHAGSNVVESACLCLLGKFWIRNQGSSH